MFDKCDIFCSLYVVFSILIVYDAHAGLPTALHSTPHRRAVTKFTMPAMSPTMTEGGIASWKIKEGESFASGDVLLEIVRSYRNYPRPVKLKKEHNRKQIKLP